MLLVYAVLNSAMSALERNNEICVMNYLSLLYQPVVSVVSRDVNRKPPCCASTSRKQKTVETSVNRRVHVQQTVTRQLRAINSHLVVKVGSVLVSSPSLLTG